MQTCEAPKNASLIMPSFFSDARENEDHRSRQKRVFIYYYYFTLLALGCSN